MLEIVFRQLFLKTLKCANYSVTEQEKLFSSSRFYFIFWIFAGSGGSVVANRLTENPDWSVLLLEAGKDESILTDVPLIASLQSVTSYNWGYKSGKQKTACLGLIDGKCNLPRGKALGGTSVINFLIHTRGNK